jgi:23S rRNA pseudouridine1911/1915/1917 synthase
MKKSTLKDRLRDGGVLVNGQPQRKATYALVAGDVVELSRDKVMRHAPLAVEILHVDHDLVVVNKPSGLLTVGTGKGTSGEATVLNTVGAMLRARGDRVGDRFFPCHRLDKGTSGVLLLPRSPEVQHFFFEHWGQTTKTYVAVVEGNVADDAGTIDAALFEDPQTLTVRVSTQPNARPARTHYRVLQRSAARTLVELQIDTGRKHQIRVHMLHLGHAVVGDDRYSKMSRRVRLCLHARALEFPHPADGVMLRFEAKVPSLFADLMRSP